MGMKKSAALAMMMGIMLSGDDMYGEALRDMGETKKRPIDPEAEQRLKELEEQRLLLKDEQRRIKQGQQKFYYNELGETEKFVWAINPRSAKKKINKILNK